MIEILPVPVLKFENGLQSGNLTKKGKLSIREERVVVVRFGVLVDLSSSECWNLYISNHVWRTIYAWISAKMTFYWVHHSSWRVYIGCTTGADSNRGYHWGRLAQKIYPLTHFDLSLPNNNMSTEPYSVHFGLLMRGFQPLLHGHLLGTPGGFYSVGNLF
jgi:hypothetical protein